LKESTLAKLHTLLAAAAQVDVADVADVEDAADVAVDFRLN
jgi:hypothetical protein